MELLSPACFVPLSSPERLGQLYLAYGGTQCFTGRSRTEQFRILAEQIGIDACIYSEVDFYRAWLGFLDPTACSDQALDALQGAVYALLYAAAADTSLVSPACFYGLSPELKEQAIFEVAGGDIIHPATLTRTVSGLILLENFSTGLDSWSNPTGKWSWVNERTLVSFGPVPRVFMSPGTLDPDGVREAAVLQDDAETWWAVSDGGNGTDGWRQFLRRSSDRGLTWTELGAFAGGIGSYAATATGWIEKRGATYIDLVVTADSVFSAPNTGLPAAPYGFEIRTASAMDGSWTIVGTVAKVPGTWTADQVLPGGTLKVGSTYYHFGDGRVVDSINVGILTSSSPTGPWAQLSTTAIADSSTAGLLGKTPEDPKPFYHPDLDRYIVLACLIESGVKTDSNAVLSSAAVDDWSAMTVSVGMHVSPLYGINAVGRASQMTGPEGALVFDADTGFVPVLYDTNSTRYSPGFHLGREILGAIYEPIFGFARFTSAGITVEPLYSPLPNTDFVAEFLVRFRNTTVNTSVAFEYRRDADGENAYRLVVRNQECMILQKRLAGSYSNVEVPSSTTQVGENGIWKAVRLEITTSVGTTTHKVWLDGELQINATDSELTSGTYIALSGVGADADVAKLVMYTSKSVSVSGLPPSQDVVVRTATLPVSVVTSDGSGNATITLDHWPHLALQVGATDLSPGSPIYGGDTLVYGGTPDTTAPTLSGATIESDGMTLTLAMSKPVLVGPGDTADFALTATGGAVAITYVSGNGSATLTYSLNRIIFDTESSTLDYAQPGDGIEDYSGNLLASITGLSVTNNSAVSPSAIDLLTNKVMWNKADELELADLQHILTFPDSSSPAEDLTENSTNSPRFKPALQNGLGVSWHQAQWVRNASFTALNGVSSASCAYAFRIFNTSGDTILGGPDNQALLIESVTGTVNVYVSPGNYGGFAFSDTASWHSLIAVFNGSATGNANRLKVWVDGVQQTLTFTGTIPATTGSASGFTLGALGAGVAPVDSYIGEDVYCTAAWDATTVANVHSAIVSKWGTA